MGVIGRIDSGSLERLRKRLRRSSSVRESIARQYKSNCSWLENRHERCNDHPLVGLTMGDVAGIGPEVIAAGWADPRLHALARPLVIGDPAVLERALDAGRRSARRSRVQVVAAPEEADPTPRRHPVPGGRGRTCAICRESPRGRRRAGRPRRLRVPDDGEPGWPSRAGSTRSRPCR